MRKRVHISTETDYDGQCFSTFQYVENLPFWILGGTVLRKYYCEHFDETQLFHVKMSENVLTTRLNLAVYNIGDYANNYYGAAVGFQLVKDYPDNPGDLTPWPTTTTASASTKSATTTSRTTTAVPTPTEYGKLL